ncbi:MAG: hypothetical protein ACR2KK_01160 [Acidimicrobiales bacterium]
MNRRFAARPFAAALATLALLATACGGDEPIPKAAEPATSKAAAEVVATDYGYQLPGGGIPVGQVALTLANRGTENHHLTLAARPLPDHRRSARPAA